MRILTPMSQVIARCQRRPGRPCGDPPGLPLIACTVALLLSIFLHPPAAFADESDDSINLLVEVLAGSDDADFHLDILKGINEALKGRRKLAMPKEWPKVYAKLKESKSEQVREQARALAVVFGDTSAFDALKKTLMDAKAAPDQRRAALESLINAKAGDLAPLLHELVGDKAMQLDALRALANYDDAKTPALLLAAYKNLALPQRQAAINTLASRPAYAKQLLAAVKADAVPRSDVPADAIRQLRLIEDKDVQAAIKDVWGALRDTPADKLRKIDDLRTLLSKPSTYKPDVEHGRALFTQMCAQCHLLYGYGGKLSPDLTGSNRNNLDYLLTNVVDPNATIGKDYQATEIRTEEDQLVVGLIEREDDAAVTLKTTSGSVIIPKNEIASRKLSDKSMMPEGLLETLSEPHLRDFVAYMASTRQSPMLATKLNQFGLFNSQNLTGWDGDAKYWRVESGEIIGKSDGLKEYQYLVSHMSVMDFRLTLKVKLVGDIGNSGIFFRCSPQEDGTVHGPQADIGPQWWGKLVESGGGGRGTLWDKSGEAHVKKGDWNTYEIKAIGPRVQTWINGQLCVDLTDDKLPRRGQLALQLHIGDAMEVRVKDVELEVVEGVKEEVRREK